MWNRTGIGMGTADVLTWAPVVALVALFLALVLVLALIAYDLVVVPTWDEVEELALLCLRLHAAVLAVWWVEHVTGVPVGRHARADR